MPKFNDLDLKNWKEIDLNMDSLIVVSIDFSGKNIDDLRQIKQKIEIIRNIVLLNIFIMLR